MMTLDETIEHAEWCAKESCGECADDHAQLADWLRELRRARMEIDLLKTLRDGFKADAQKYKAENDNLKDENAKLRNELKAIYMCDAYGVKCKYCKNKDLCAYLMREPGIEVK